MLGFKSFRSAKIAGIENVRMIQKGQIVRVNNQVFTFENFKMLMAS
ncbi:transposase domain protein [Orientia chuto str. Dubai]|uniref:Transposase domain protein n=1 Tax=Orientia chuto str. Dubai TaxID=1359168 RepID=A0A0F3MKQ1_9RICK|nr:transposase domain protein [Orientia chuto str. Dubai]